MQISGAVERTECVFENIHFYFCRILFFGCCRCSWLLLKTFVSPFACHTGGTANGAILCECQYTPPVLIAGVVLPSVELSSLNMASHSAIHSQSALHTLCFAVWFSLLWKSFPNRHLTSPIYQSPRTLSSCNNHMYSDNAACVRTSFAFSRTRMPTWSDAHWTNITAY